MTTLNLPASFYPTPPELVSKMLACLDFSKHLNILEPSAGDGAIVWGIAEKAAHYYHGDHYDISVDCIELDESLRQLLKHRFSEERSSEFLEKWRELDQLHYARRTPAQTRQMNEYSHMAKIIKTPVHIVHDDFLAFHCCKKYDAIVMNPPFEHGDLHLMHALELMQGGGQIVCLLNAETIRNPYTNSRKVLIRELNELDAQIQFLASEFESPEARRKTAVEVALVNVSVPQKQRSSFIFDRLQKAKEEATEVNSPKSLIRTGDKITAMVELFQFETQCGLALIREYESLRPYMLDTLDGIKPYGTTCILTLSVGTDSNHLQHCDVNEYLRETRLKYWKEMFKVPEFVDRLTSNLLKELHETVDRMADYDFTEFNIRQLYDELGAKLFQGVEDTIISVFDKLTAQHAHYPECTQNIHYYNGWRTNKAHKINKKVIVPIWGMFSSYSWSKNAFDVSVAYSLLSDIEKVLNYLDDGTTGDVDLQEALKAANAGAQTRGIVCKYFTVDLFKKGTCHIKFRDEAIVDKLNIYGCRRKGWLPPCYGKSRYEDMTPEEQAVVEEFQGRSAYEAVCADPGTWLVEPQKTLLLGAHEG
jgi:phospholipid N-methyltransferase